MHCRFAHSHLHVVVLDCEEHTGTTIIVVVESLVGRKDTTTILKPGDHVFITRESYVNYRRAKTTSKVDLQRLLDSGKAKPLDSISSDVLARIQKGIVDSPFTPRYVVDHYRRKTEDQAFRKLG